MTNQSQSPAIEVRSLTRVFKNGPRAVDAINLEVRAGEIYGFLGPNGAGKSTTILMLTTLLPPTSGTALVAGYDIVQEGRHVRAAIGAALQEAGLDPLLSGREHLMLQAALHSLPGHERARRVDLLLGQFGLLEAAGRKVMGYSGGMKRRLDLAMSLVHRPRILFLDEPTTGLDPQSRSAIWAEVRRLARAGGCYRLPDNTVSRRGRCALRPDWHHRSRKDRGRGHAGVPQGGDRPPHRGGPGR